MRIAIATLGSRGDVQPFLALAVALSRAGHRVRLATNEPFRSLVAEHGIEFAPLGGDIKEIVGDRGRAALLAAHGNPIASLRALRAFVGPLVKQGLDLLPAALEGADVIIGQMLAPGAAHYAERHGLPYIEAAYDPVVPTRAFPHPGAPLSVPPGVPSWLTYIAAEQVFWQAFRADVNAFRRGALGLGDAPFFGPTKARVARRPPALLGYSHALVPRPSDWPEHVVVTGAWLLDTPSAWNPPQKLVDFIEAGPAPIYIGFGSMTVERPEEMTRTLLDAVRRARRRAVLSTGWGGLAAAEGADDVMFVGDVPHAWLFPRMAGVVHHGGPSTTAEGLRAAVPQLVIPFLSDQPFWGHHVARSGVGPAPIPIADLDAARLACALEQLGDDRTIRRAAEIGRRVRAEPGADRAAEALPRLVDWYRRGSGRRG
jgi:UDP:flavonoid glycosyltransferase YjiC (YdhE family)